MSSNNTYEPYIQLSYKILERLEDFREIQQAKDNTIENLKKFKALLISNEELLSYFPVVKEEAYSFLSYGKVNNSNQSKLSAVCDKLKSIKTYIKTGEEHIGYIQQKCLSGNETVIEQAKDLFHSTYDDLSINKGIDANVTNVKKQIEKLEIIIYEYEVEQERIKQEEERKRREEEERQRREEEERRRREEEEREKREKQRELLLNILKWVGIVAGIGIVATLLIVYIIIPVVAWIIAHIWWIVAGIVIIGFIVIKASS